MRYVRFPRLGRPPRVCAASISILLLASCAGKRVEPSSEPTTVAEVIERHMAALGGAEAMLAGTSRTARGRVEIPELGETGSFEVHQTRDNDMWMYMELTRTGVARQGVVNGIPWKSVAGSDAAVLEGEQAAEMLCAARWNAWLFPPDSYVSQELLGKESFRGAPAFKVHMVGDCGLEWTHYFSVADGWLIGSESTTSSPLGPLPFTIELEYGKFAGGWFPAVDIRDYAGMFTMKQSTESYAIDVPPDQSLEIPPEIRAMLDD